MQTHTLDGKPRLNPIKIVDEDMLLFILIYLRDAPKQVLLGALFGMPQPLAISHSIETGEIVKISV